MNQPDSKAARIVASEGETEGDGDFEEGVTLEELSRSYALALGRTVPDEPQRPVGSNPAATQDDAELFDPVQDELDHSQACPLTPLTILEAILFVGRPDSGPISAVDIAALMRGVEESEIAELVEQLNDIYRQSGRVTRIVAVGNGYRVELSKEWEPVRDRFYGPSREVRLNQAAIDCLALVAYQPGITRERIEQQRGQPSGSVLNQLVRRELLELRRQAEGNAYRSHYYPTQRLVQLAGLTTLDDLPQVEEWQP